VLVLGVPVIYLWHKKSHTARADQARADPDKRRLLKESSTPSYGSVAIVEGMHQKNSELSTCAMLKLHVGTDIMLILAPIHTVI